MGRATAIDLFSGCGGLTLGLKQAGFKVVSAIEIDSLAAETYRVNHSGVALLNQDIRTVNVKALRSTLKFKKGDLDLLAGCPPCQGFSTLRTNNKTVAVNDSRNNLMFCFLDFVREFQPKSIMMENVPGLMNGNRITKFVKELETQGYFVNYRTLDVADYEVPQRRKRFILLASRKGPVTFSLPSSKRKTVRDVLEGYEAASVSKDPAHNHGEIRSKKILEVISLIPKDGGSRAALPRRLLSPCHRNTNGFKDVFGRMKWDDVAPTITSGCVNPSKGRFLHPSLNRTITVREAALLQGFPRNYFFSMRRGKYAAALMVGNALPPRFIRHHARQLKKFI